MRLKKSRILKKSGGFLLIFLVFFCSISFCSCGKKNKTGAKISTGDSETKIETEKKIRDFIFYDIIGLLKTKNSEKKGDFSYLKKILSYKYFENGLSFYYFEKYFPEYLGVFESSDFFVAEFENGDWVESLIFKTEEERIADEISFLEKSGAENSDIFAANDAEFEKIIKSEQNQKEFTDKNGNLIFMEFEGELFIPQKTQNGYFIIFGQNNQVTKKFYNFDFRLESVEKWSVKNSALQKEQNPEFSQKYFYDEKTQKIAKTETIAPTQKIISYYNENEKLTKKQTFKIQDEKTFLIFENEIKYDENLNIAENKSAEYFYNEDFSARTDVFTKKYVYAQNQEEIPPDFEYYEDEVLKMKNKYSTEKGTYTSQIFFGDELSVKIYYQNEKKTREVYFSGEKVLQAKNYEN